MEHRNLAAETYITVVGFQNFAGKDPFRIGAEFTCEKEPDNIHDDEAIRVTHPLLGTVGYLANGVNTKANGTATAGRVYDRVGKKFTVRVRFTTQTKIICEITDFGKE